MNASKYQLILFICFLFVFSCTSPENKEDSGSSLSYEKQSGQLIIKDGEQVLLGYQYETKYPPAGVDSVFKRSAFIHPLNSPHGQVLTQIQPEDHYHHYGIWNPWTHVLFEGDTLDFWNLYKREGTVRFSAFDTVYAGDKYVEAQIQETHIAYPDSLDKAALNEKKTIRVTKVDDDSFFTDLTIELTCATESPFLILEYRYAGLGWRATEEWHKGNSEVFTHDVSIRNDVDGTTGRWCVVQGELGEDYGGIVMMSHPENFNHPEPLRVWPAGQNGRGDLFASFTTTKNTDWLLEPGKTYTLRYRLYVFNGKMTQEQAEAAWQAYAK